MGTCLSQLPWRVATGLTGAGMPGLGWPHQGILDLGVYIERRAKIKGRCYPWALLAKSPVGSLSPHLPDRGRNCRHRRSEKAVTKDD